jgi:uncharacterized protein YndB with AHSA1/START domain
MPSTSTRAVAHDSFTIERDFDFPPEQMFAAFASREAKASWFGGMEGCKDDIRQMDFRVGGSERVRVLWPGGKISDFSAYYHDIVDGERIVYSYAMKLNEVPISVSLATIEFKPHGSGTRLVLTEQGAFLDGFEDKGSREQGTRTLLDRLAAAL